jgi:hypothetical protein
MGLYEIFGICGNPIKLDLPNDMTINNQVNVFRLKVVDPEKNSN